MSALEGEGQLTVRGKKPKPGSSARDSDDGDDSSETDEPADDDSDETTEDET